MLDTIRLTNFKAFADAEIPLGRLTLLTGLNSAGKSTVLQSLGLLRQSGDAGLFGDEDEGGFLLNGTMVDLGTGQDVLHEDYVPVKGTERGIALALDADGTEFRWAAEYHAENDLLPLRSGAGQSGLPLSLFDRGFQYLKAERLSPAVSYPRSHEAAIRRGFLGCQGEHAVNFLRHHADDLMVEEPLRHPAVDSAGLLHQVDAWMREICPGVNLEASAIDGTDLVRLGYQFGTAGPLASNRPHRPTNVGFGLSYVLPIVIACLSAGPGSLLLLENPEAHLHPRGQTRMAMLMAAAAAAGAQLIVETHSDHVLNGLRIAVKNKTLPHTDVRLLYFHRSAGRVEILSPNVGPDGMLSDWPDGFFDEWENSLDQLLD
ncbi:AAA family ATPase [Actinomadura hibisca]|uniref:AAA family ATPase n=1 Tax=Actinomadura hibisca TaxID=68565 RepID=UPI00083147FE|nr:DUF3696 domain-containing protein [Actinomadura hibisca]